MHLLTETKHQSTGRVGKNTLPSSVFWAAIASHWLSSLEARGEGIVSDKVYRAEAPGHRERERMVDKQSNQHIPPQPLFHKNSVLLWHCWPLPPWNNLFSWHPWHYILLLFLLPRDAPAQCPFPVPLRLSIPYMLVFSTHSHGYICKLETHKSLSPAQIPFLSFRLQSR